MEYIKTGSEWIGKHPEIWVPIVMAIFNFFAKPRTEEEYASYPPRLAAFMKFWAALWPDLEKARKAFPQVLSGKPDPTKESQS